MAMWNAWRGCKKCSDGCLHCYIHKGDFKRNVNTNEIVKTKDLCKQAKLAIFEFIESWYNNVRIHSSLNYKTPDEKYNEYLRNIA